MQNFDQIGRKFGKKVKSFFTRWWWAFQEIGKKVKNSK